MIDRLIGILFAAMLFGGASCTQLSGQPEESFGPATATSHRTAPPRPSQAGPTLVPADSTAQAPTLVSVQVLGTDGSSRSAATQFEVTKTREVIVQARFRGSPGTYPVSFAFHAPTGGLFAHEGKSLVIDSSHQGTLEAQLQVAGTQIQNYGLKGRWEAQVKIGDAPLGTTAFQLQ